MFLLATFHWELFVCSYFVSEHAILRSIDNGCARSRKQRPYASFSHLRTHSWPCHRRGYCRPITVFAQDAGESQSDHQCGMQWWQCQVCTFWTSKQRLSGPLSLSLSLSVKCSSSAKAELCLICLLCKHKLSPLKPIPKMAVLQFIKDWISTQMIFNFLSAHCALPSTTHTFSTSPSGSQKTIHLIFYILGRNEFNER